MIFTAETVKSRLRDTPFVPVRFVLSTGREYDVYHPDLVFVGKQFLIIGTPAPDDPETADRVTRVALVHVAELQDLPPVRPPAGSNGQGA